MITIEQLQRRIRAGEDLQSLVRTMKAIAAANINQYERAVTALASYGRTLELTAKVVIQNRPPDMRLDSPRPSGPLGALVIGSDMGLVGQFNERVADHATAAMARLQPRPDLRTVVAIGMRAATSLEQAGHTVQEAVALPGGVSTITPAVQRLLLHIEGWRAEMSVRQVVLFYNRPLSNISYTPTDLMLLPINLDLMRELADKPWPTKVLPTFTGDWDSLFSGLTRQQLFVGLYRALAESMASENASRLASMQNAEQSIAERLDELNAEYHLLRQSAITAELLDIISGFEALEGEQ